MANYSVPKDIRAEYQQSERRANVFACCCLIPLSFFVLAVFMKAELLGISSVIMLIACFAVADWHYSKCQSIIKRVNKNFGYDDEEETY